MASGAGRARRPHPLTRWPPPAHAHHVGRRTPRRAGAHRPGPAHTAWGRRRRTPRGAGRTPRRAGAYRIGPAHIASGRRRRTPRGAGAYRVGPGPAHTAWDPVRRTPRGPRSGAHRPGPAHIASGRRTAPALCAGTARCARAPGAPRRPTHPARARSGCAPPRLALPRPLTHTRWGPHTPPTLCASTTGCARARGRADGERHPPVHPATTTAGRARLDPEALDAMVCARRPGMLRGKEQLRAALRVALVKDAATTRCSTRSSTSSSRAGEAGRPRPQARSGARARRPVRRGSLDDFTFSDTLADTPQQGHPHQGQPPGKAVGIRDFLQARRPRRAVQPAPGGQQDRPRRDDRRDHALRGQPGPHREGNRVQIETESLHPGSTPARSRLTQTCPWRSRRCCPG